MNLYLISQAENNGWDTYDAVVVAATNEDEARAVNPNGNDSWAKLLVLVLIARRGDRGISRCGSQGNGTRNHSCIIQCGIGGRKWSHNTGCKGNTFAKSRNTFLCCFLTNQRTPSVSGFVRQMHSLYKVDLTISKDNQCQAIKTFTSDRPSQAEVGRSPSASTRDQPSLT